MKPTLIIVDDVKILREELRRILDREFEIVAEAEDGGQAVEAFQRFHPRLMVMDVVMPNMSGIEATRRIMGGPGPIPKIAMLSAMREDRTVLQALEAGACDYLFKPVDPDKLLQVLRGLL